MDFRAVLASVWLPIVVWASAVCGVAVVHHQPGVVCATPVAWFISFWVGIRASDRSSSSTRTIRLLESALAGGVFGILSGILFAAIVPTMGPIAENERRNAVVLVIAMTVIGSVVSAILSLAAAAAQERRRV